MQEFVVNKSSWHYRLNAYIASKNTMLWNKERVTKFLESKDNFCSYWSYTLTSLLKVALLTVFILIVVILASLAAYTIYLEVAANPWGALTTVLSILAILVIAFAFMVGGWMLDERKKEKMRSILYEDETETSLSRAKWYAWKNKVCLPVRFKDD